MRLCDFETSAPYLSAACLGQIEQMFDIQGLECGKYLPWTLIKTKFLGWAPSIYDRPPDLMVFPNSSNGSLRRIYLCASWSPIKIGGDF